MLILTILPIVNEVDSYTTVIIIKKSINDLDNANWPSNGNENSTVNQSHQRRLKPPIRAFHQVATLDCVFCFKNHGD